MSKSGEAEVGAGDWRKVERRLGPRSVPLLSLSTCLTSLQNYWPEIRTVLHVGVPGAGTGRLGRDSRGASDAERCTELH